MQHAANMANAPFCPIKVIKQTRIHLAVETVCLIISLYTHVFVNFPSIGLKVGRYAVAPNAIPNFFSNLSGVGVGCLNKSKLDFCVNAKIIINLTHEGERFNVSSATRGWGVKFSGKNVNITHEWLLTSCTKTYQIGSEIDAEDGDSSEGQRDVGEDEYEEGTDLRDVTGQGVCDRLLEIVKDQTACKTTSTYQ